MRLPIQAPFFLPVRSPVSNRPGTFSGYGQGPQEYAKRFNAATADSAISRTLGSAVLPGILCLWKQC